MRPSAPSSPPLLQRRRQKAEAAGHWHAKSRLRQATPPARQAEACIAAALALQGWQILEQNLRWIGFELDLVAVKGTTLIVVEVKARRQAPTTAWAAAALLPPRKRQALRRGADAMVSRFGLSGMTVRVDLAVVHPRLEATSNQTLAIAYFVDALN